MTVAQIIQQVNEQVSEQFGSTLLERMVQSHARKHRMRTDCECSFCRIKADATYYIGIAAYPRDYTGYRPTGLMLEAGESFIDEKRDFIRAWYRQRLRQAKEQ